MNDYEGLTPENVAKAEDDVHKGMRAQHLLQDPVLDGAIKAVKNTALDTLLNANPGSDMARDYHFLYLAITQVEAELMSLVSGAKEAGQVLQEHKQHYDEESHQIKRKWIKPHKE